MGKITILSAIVMLLVSGCAYMQLPESPEITRFREGTSYSRQVFFPVYESDLSIWVGKTLEDLQATFQGNPGRRTMDVYGNGYVVYNNYPVEGFRTRFLTFYVKGGKIYNVVKE